MLYNIALSHIRSLGASKLRALIDYFGTAENVFAASSDVFDNMGIVKKYLGDERSKRDLLVDAEKELEFINKNHIKVHLLDDESYPYRLRECPDAPILLYTTGNVDLNSGKFISIVGTRKSTFYGRDLSYRLVEGLKESLGSDLTILSGLAHGIDVSAHRAALDLGVRTMGIVAHGLDTIYPAANRNVAASMVKSGGCIITEYPTKTQSIASNFLSRNRIIAGMCDVLVVVESAAKGGALVTAGIANSYARSVYAFPGRVGDKFSEGCNMLLRTNMAGLIQSAEDIISAESWDVIKKPVQMDMFPSLTSEQQKICDILKGGVSYISDIALEMKSSTSQISTLLIEMELNGIIQGVAGGRYRICL